MDPMKCYSQRHIIFASVLQCSNKESPCAMSGNRKSKTSLATMFLWTVFIMSVSLANSQRTPIYMSVIDTLTLSTRVKFRANYTIGAAFNAINDINNRSDILPNHELIPSLVLIPPTAPAGSAVRTFVEVFRDNQDNISAFVGPPLSSEAIYSALLAAKADIPYLSWVATSARFSDTSDYSTFVRTSGNLALLGPAVVQFMDIFSWDRIAYIEYHDTTHRSGINAMRSYLLPALKAANKRVILDLELGDFSNLPVILNRAKQVARSEPYIPFCLHITYLLHAYRICSMYIAICTYILCIYILHSYGFFCTVVYKAIIDLLLHR